MRRSSWSTPLSMAGWRTPAGRGGERPRIWACSGSIRNRCAGFDGCTHGDLAVLPVVEALLGGRRVPDLVQLLQRLDQCTVELVLAAFTQASRWQRDVALYAFGGDPWAVSGWIAAQRARYAASAVPDRWAS